MKFYKKEIDGAFLIDLEKYEDKRGFFARSFCTNEFLEHGISFTPVQANIAYNYNKNTLRGLHYQSGKFAESKLVRCIKGALYDVIIDLRPDSPTYKKWMGVDLTEGNRKLFYIPEGCAHGYQTMTNDAELFYMVSAFYAPDFEKGIRWNDPVFNIQWKKYDNLIISDKDRNWPDFELI